MSKEQNKTSEERINIIKNEQDLMEKIRSVVQVFSEKGEYKTDLHKIIDLCWSEYHKEQPVEQPHYNDAELRFFTKARKFCEFFKDHLDVEGTYDVLCSMFITFEENETIRSDKIEYNCRHRLLKQWGIKTAHAMYQLEHLVDHIDFSNNEIKYCEPNEKAIITVYYLGEFMDFFMKHAVSKGRTTRTALMYIWIVNNYF